MVVIFALVATVLLGGAGLAIDYSRSRHLQSAMQSAIDAAVLAGVHAEGDDRIRIAQATFDENIKDAHAPKIRLSFTTGGSGELSGRATAKLDVSLMRALGFKTVDVSTDATAIAEGSGKVCILVLDHSASQSFLVNSGATVIAPDCEIHVKSTASPAAIFNTSSTIDTKRLCIAGKDIIDNGGTHPNLETSCNAANDPYAGKFPAPSSAICNHANANYNGGTVNLTPGVYCGWTNFNAQPTVNFAPGVYVITGGGWNVNGGTWTGNGVSFFFADQSKIQFNSAVAAKLTPPTSGPYQDVIIFEAEGLAPSPFVVDDSKGFDIAGIIYLPSRDTILNSASNAEVRDFSMVVKTLILDDTNWKLSSSAVGGASSGGAQSVRLID